VGGFVVLRNQESEARVGFVRWGVVVVLRQTAGAVKEVPVPLQVVNVSKWAGAHLRTRL